YSPPPPSAVIYLLTLHDALPIWSWNSSRSWWIAPRSSATDHHVHRTLGRLPPAQQGLQAIFIDHGHTQGVRLVQLAPRLFSRDEDRKSTRLNSSHVKISYAVFCL